MGETQFGRGSLSEFELRNGFGRGPRRPAPLSPAGAGQNIPPLTDEWATYSAQDMTWEGWFHVNEAPAERSMLMGTFGTNDAETLYSGLHRRRHGAVWIDPDGSVGLSSNTGTTSGFIQGPQLVDGKWHHVAAVWNQTAGGGAQIAKSFKLMHVRYSTIIGNQDMREELTARMEEAMALEANASATDVWFYYADEQIIGGEGRLLVSFVVNCPIETVDMMLARLVSSHTFENRMLWALFNVTLITNAFTGLAPVQDNVYIYDDVFPTITYVGIAHLYVDGVAFPGLVIYSPNEENIADNGQFLVGGGHQARPVDLEVANLRLWSVALTQEQLAQQAQVCQVPDSESFIGGAWPFSLHGAWPLNGNFTNAFGPFANFSEQSVWEEQLGSGYNSVDAMNYPYWKNLLTAEVVQTYTQSMYHHMSRKLGGGFVRGGVCNFNACPAISPVNACPLQRSVGFASSAECEEFAGFNFCRLAGSTRNRPSMPHLQGCHL
ncbi:unnamed protein product [Effrenium voratum]|nr:unnamed protein product [Effrenium voratum]